MLASIYFSSFCLAVKVNENPTMGGDGDGEEVTFEEGDDVEEEDADIDAVSVLLIMIDYVQISSQWTALESLKQWKLKLGANEVGWGGGGGGQGGIHVLYWWGGANEAKLLYFKKAASCLDIVHLFLTTALYFSFCQHYPYPERKSATKSNAQEESQMIEFFKSVD